MLKKGIGKYIKGREPIKATYQASIVSPHQVEYPSTSQFGSVLNITYSESSESNYNEYDEQVQTRCNAESSYSEDRGNSDDDLDNTADHHSVIDDNDSAENNDSDNELAVETNNTETADDSVDNEPVQVLLDDNSVDNKPVQVPIDDNSVDNKPVPIQMLPVLENCVVGIGYNTLKCYDSGDILKDCMVGIGYNPIKCYKPISNFKYDLCANASTDYNGFITLKYRHDPNLSECLPTISPYTIWTESIQLTGVGIDNGHHYYSAIIHRQVTHDGLHVVASTLNITVIHSNFDAYVKNVTIDPTPPKTDGMVSIAVQILPPFRGASKWALTSRVTPLTFDDLHSF